MEDAQNKENTEKLRERGFYDSPTMEIHADGSVTLRKDRDPGEWFEFRLRPESDRVEMSGHATFSVDALEWLSRIVKDICDRQLFMPKKSKKTEEKK